MRNARLAVAAACALAAAGAACSSEHEVGVAQLREPWVRAADSGATTAAYLRVVNRSPNAITVTGFSSDAAPRVELHESMTDAHMMMHMTPKPSVTIAGGDSLTLRPNGMHLMLIGTTRRLSPGDTVHLELRLSTGTTVSATADVRAP